MNYFLVIFIALPLVLLMMVKVKIKTRTILTIVKDSISQVTYNRMERDKSEELSN